MANRWESILAAVTKAFAPKAVAQQDHPRYSVDRSLRIIRSVEKIAATLPDELRPKTLEFCQIAALFLPVSPLKDPTDADEVAADLLQTFLKENEIDTVLSILREHRTKNAKMTEARLLADAAALDDFGMIGFWSQCRTAHASAKTLEQFIRMFRTQHDYGYWSSRLRDGFYYPASRRAATERLAHATAVFQILQQQHMAEDIR